MIYQPDNVHLRLVLDAGAYDWDVIELEGKRILKPDVRVENGISTLKRHPFQSDSLWIGIRK
ncbi:hypothetical protein FHS19_003099 [Paenibacillus rhizosphaerae]|uniref:Uncharacterized protein n=1 Tax=Paenibacillus rhizosphaerae TaxID=297318 RepID=A0A839TNV1_9BACL|nr:hypothetical protein [Paenibacillus rhizosphaerae]MBB3128445.1 hypothetical protein [Paenibacillus rhizosphaerae]